MFVYRYDEHGLPGQLSAATDSTDVQEPAYADAQIVISTTNSSHDQYRKLRKEVFPVAILYQMGAIRDCW